MSAKNLARIATNLENMDACNHINHKHRSKFMCYNCYVALGNKKKATKCIHKNSPHHSHGLCQGCYQKIYYKVINDPETNAKKIMHMKHKDGQNLTDADDRHYAKLMSIKNKSKSIRKLK